MHALFSTKKSARTPENSAHFSEQKAETTVKNERERTQKKRADGRSAYNLIIRLLGNCGLLECDRLVYDTRPIKITYPLLSFTE